MWSLINSRLKNSPSVAVTFPILSTHLSHSPIDWLTDWLTIGWMSDWCLSYCESEPMPICPSKPHNWHISSFVAAVFGHARLIGTEFQFESESEPLLGHFLHGRVMRLRGVILSFARPPAVTPRPVLCPSLLSHSRRPGWLIIVSGLLPRGVALRCPSANVNSRCFGS